jgi:Domain of unknown function (DUF4375)
MPLLDVLLDGHLRLTLMTLDLPDLRRASAAAEIDTLRPEFQQLFWLALLNERWGEGGIYTFLRSEFAAYAPQVQQALEEAGLSRHGQIFAEARRLLQSPSIQDLRTRHQLFKLCATFGSQKDYQAEIENFAQRNPFLLSWAEQRRTQLSEGGRLEWLTDQLLLMADEDPEELDDWPEPYRLLCLLEMFYLEVMNGGIHQFFSNSSGDWAPDVVEALEAVSLPNHAKALQQGIDMFDAPYPTDRDKRGDNYFAGEWGDWDRKLDSLTKIFHDGAVPKAMLKLAKRENILPQ